MRSILAYFALVLLLFSRTTPICAARQEALATISTKEGMHLVTVQKTEYGGWPNCYRISNGKMELVVTTDVGPRIIRMGVPGGPNEFKEFDEMMGKTGGDEWRIYGGHRLWHSPEVKPRSYAPDNAPVEFREEGNTVHLTQPVEVSTGIKKEIEIRLSPDAAHARITHRLTNTNLWEVELAPWALSVMAPGGTAFLPQPAKIADADRLLPNRTLVLWPYTDMSDPRHVWGKEFFLVKQQDADHPTKIGVSANDGWVAYANHGHLFVKRFSYDTAGTYPDHGCSVEIYTATGMLEMETLGPLRKLAPNATAEHVEDWYLLESPAVTDEAGAKRAADLIQKQTVTVQAGKV